MKKEELMAWLKEDGKSTDDLAEMLGYKNDTMVRQWISGSREVPKWMEYVTVTRTTVKVGANGVLPCPFCGMDWERQGIRNNYVFRHPKGNECILTGKAFSATEEEMNRR